MVMTNNGDVRSLRDDGDLSVFLESPGGCEDRDVDCTTVGNGNTDKDSGVPILPICWRQMKQRKWRGRRAAVVYPLTTDDQESDEDIPEYIDHCER